MKKEIKLNLNEKTKDSNNISKDNKLHQLNNSLSNDDSQNNEKEEIYKKINSYLSI